MDVLREVAEERIRQDQKWGEQNHDPFKWSVILGEEVGEVSRDILEAYFSKDLKGNRRWDPGMLKAYRYELVQVAAVAVAMIECLDRGEWDADQR